ncbi:MAG: NAD-dependent epimerase/dehydratase family protein [Acidimicrobiia bacterium]
MKALVTGATGVVGGAVLRHLIQSGHTLRALVRPGRELPMGVEAVVGDVLDYESLLRACTDVEVVFHLAGINRMCDPDPTEMFRVNVDGTRNVIRACRVTGVRRMVHTSSAATIGEPQGSVGSEDTIHRGGFHSNYERSKFEAEQVVVAEGGDLDVVIVNPSSVQGPGRATGTGKLILDVVNGRLPFLVDTRLSIVDIDDCARGHLLAAERGRSGRRYLLNSFSITMDEAVSLLAEATGRPLNVRYLPGPLVAAAAGLIWLPFRLSGRSARVCPEMVRTLRHGHTYDGSRATNELGLVYTSAAGTLRRLVEWAAGEGLLVT